MIRTLRFYTKFCKKVLYGIVVELHSWRCATVYLARPMDFTESSQTHYNKVGGLILQNFSTATSPLYHSNIPAPPLHSPGSPHQNRRLTIRVLPDFETSHLHVILAEYPNSLYPGNPMLPIHPDIPYSQPERKETTPPALCGIATFQTLSPHLPSRICSL